MPEPPRRLREALSTITHDVSTNSGIELMGTRAAEFASPFAAKLAGVFVNPKARAHYDEVLDQMWHDSQLPREVPEVVIGAGLHAAIYCSVRVAEGHPKPLVIEAHDRAGGAFAISETPSFWLNSANRPGNVGTPGRAEALNYLPGAPVQPAELTADEYQPNTSLAFAIRTALAMNARVVTGRKVASADSTSVTLEDGAVIHTARVLWATGLGEPAGPPEIDGKRMMHYMQFLNHLDQDFPLRGLDRVAVVGAGDSGRTTIEALTGQGPAAQRSVAQLDWVNRIDWYGVRESCRFKEGWRDNNRSRYQGIARLLPSESGRSDGRVTPKDRRADQTGLGFEGAYIDGARYDLVIWATGFTPGLDVESMIEYRQGGRALARMAESGVFVVGPAADLADAREYNVPSEVPENAVAVFRYADRTAALAMHLPRLTLSLDEPAPDQDEPSKPSKPIKDKEGRFTVTTSAAEYPEGSF